MSPSSRQDQFSVETVARRAWRRRLHTETIRSALRFVSFGLDLLTDEAGYENTDKQLPDYRLKSRQHAGRLVDRRDVTVAQGAQSHQAEIKEVALLIVNVLKQIEGEEADTILLEIFMRASGKTQWDIIPLFAERKMVDAVTVLTEYIRPIQKWGKERSISLQEEVCRSLGVLRSLEAADALIAAALVPGVASRSKAKPDSIRATATWALTQLPKDPKVDSALEKLKNDRSDLVQKAAELAEFFRE